MRDLATLNVEAWLLRLICHAGVSMSFAAGLAFLAPFGTYSFNTVSQIGYWTALMAAWLVLTLAASWIVGHVPRLRSSNEALLQMYPMVLAMLPMMVFTGVANNMMTGWQPNPDELAELFVAILLVGGSCTHLADRLVKRVMNTRSDRLPDPAVVDIEPERTA